VVAAKKLKNENPGALHFWFLMALCLFAFIYFYERHITPAACSFDEGSSGF